MPLPAPLLRLKYYVNSNGIVPRMGLHGHVPEKFQAMQLVQFCRCSSENPYAATQWFFFLFLLFSVFVSCRAKFLILLCLALICLEWFMAECKCVCLSRDGPRKGWGNWA